MAGATMVLYVVVSYFAISALIRTECGKPAIPPNTISANIVGGETATPHSWPWQTQVLYSWDDVTYNHMCGATIIDESTLISAAHCFTNTDIYYKFSFGGHLEDHTKEDRVELYAEQIILHENYRNLGSLGLFNDIALIKLQGSIPFNSMISPACLPNNASNAGDMAYVTGWGDLEKIINTPTELQQVRVPITSETECKQSYLYGGDPSMFCAGYYDAGGKDACQGDSGGPLVVHDQAADKWDLVGIVSWGHGCADAGKLGAYADVHYFTEWIDTNRS